VEPISIWHSLIQLSFGLGLLYLGGEGLVRGASNLALRLGLSPLVIGLTVVAFGTSAPELVVSLDAALKGSTDVAIGNVVGSNICNIGLILALSAMIRPLSVEAKIVRVDLPLLLVVSLALLGLLACGELSRLEGGFLVFGLIAFCSLTVYLARHAHQGTAVRVLPGSQTAFGSIFRCLLLIVVGLVLLVYGGDCFVSAAVGLAQSFQVSEAVIGLTIVAVGTSLPELATSLIAALKRESDIAIGNVVGSNLFNILGVLGVSSLVSPLPLGSVSWMDLFIMCGFSILCLPLVRTGWSLTRAEGALLLVLYVTYLGWQFW